MAWAAVIGIKKIVVSTIDGYVAEARHLPSGYAVCDRFHWVGATYPAVCNMDGNWSTTDRHHSEFADDLPVAGRRALYLPG